MSESISTFENLSDNVLEFPTREEFTEYYEKHKEDIDKMPTRGINVKYKIIGYKIGRQKGKIIFLPTTQRADESSNTLVDEKLDVLTTKINRLEKNMKTVFDKLNELIQLLTSSQDSRSQSSYTSANFDTYGRTHRMTYQ